MSDFMLGMSDFTRGVAVFISYAEEDKEHLERLRSQLIAYQLQGLMTIWDSSKVEPGQMVEQEILDHLNTARIILLLISLSFLGSNRCLQQMQCAMQRRAIGEIRVIPVLVRPTAGWQDMPVGQLAPLPADGTAVVNMSNPEQAFHDIASSVCVITKQFLRKDRDPTSGFDDHRYLQNFGPYPSIFSGKAHSSTTTYMSLFDQLYASLSVHRELSSQLYNILRAHLGEQEFIRLSTEVGSNIWQIVEQVLGESDDRERNR